MRHNLSELNVSECGPLEFISESDISSSASGENKAARWRFPLLKAKRSFQGGTFILKHPDLSYGRIQIVKWIIFHCSEWKNRGFSKWTLVYSVESWRAVVRLARIKFELTDQFITLRARVGRRSDQFAVYGHQRRRGQTGRKTVGKCSRKRSRIQGKVKNQRIEIRIDIEPLKIYQTNRFRSPPALQNYKLSLGS